MTYNWKDETERYADEEIEESAVKVVMGRSDSIEWPNDSPMTTPEEEVEDPGKANPDFDARTPWPDPRHPSHDHFELARTPDLPAPSPRFARRSEIIEEGTQLAYDAIETFRAALETISITDISVMDKYGKILRDMTSAAEDFERKL